MMQYYVYGYFEPESNVPFYIGKGRGNRAYVHLELKHLQRAKWPFHIKLREMVIKDVLPRINILKDGLTEAEAFEEEIRLISLYGRVDLGTGVLLNCSMGGDGPSGRIVSLETRALLREINTGKRHTLESRHKISESLMGQTQSPMSVEKRAAKRRGTKVPSELLATMSYNTRYQMKSPESRAIIAESNRRRRGEIRSAETREKISQSNIGKKRTPEQCANISVGCKKPVESFCVLTGVLIKKYPSALDTEADGYKQAKVSDVCNGRSKQHMGVRWRFSSS